MTDTIQDILNVATGVLADYADDLDQSRIARMARWILYNLGADVDDRHLGPVSCVAIDASGVRARQIGDQVTLDSDQKSTSLSDEQARQLATALLICVERSEHYYLCH